MSYMVFLKKRKRLESLRSEIKLSTNKDDTFHLSTQSPGVPSNI